MEPGNNAHVDCPFLKNERFYESQLETFARQLEAFGEQIDDLKSFKAKIIGFALGGSFFISTLIALLSKFIK